MKKTGIKLEINRAMSVAYFDGADGTNSVEFDKNCNKHEDIIVEIAANPIDNAIKTIVGYEKEALRQAKLAKRDGAKSSEMCSEAMAFSYKLCHELLSNSKTVY